MKKILYIVLVFIAFTAHADTFESLTVTGTSSNPLSGEILFKPVDLDYGYGIISWYVKDYTRKDVIMQAHHAEFNDPYDIHDHFSIYTSNASRLSTVKRVNIPLATDIANWTFENSTLEVQGFGSSTNPLLHVNNTYAPAQTSQNLLKLTNGATNPSYNSVLNISQYGTSSAISILNQAPSLQTGANIDSTGKYGFAHTVNSSGGYGLNIKTNGSVGTSNSFGLVKFTNTTTSDVNPTLWIDNRSLGNSLQIKNNTVSQFIVDTTGKIGIGTSSPSANLSIGGTGTTTIEIGGKSCLQMYAPDGTVVRVTVKNVTYELISEKGSCK